MDLDPQTDSRLKDNATFIQAFECWQLEHYKALLTNDKKALKFKIY